MAQDQDDVVGTEEDPPTQQDEGQTAGTGPVDSSDTFTLVGPNPDPAVAPVSVQSPLAAAPDGAAPDYDKYGVPSLDFVRNKIEGRYATSIGATELAQQTPEVTTAAERAVERERLAQEALDRIRQSLRDNKQS